MRQRYLPEYPSVFTLTEEHLALMRQMTVDWWNCEFGAPAIDPKRPYGNGDVVMDIISILEWPGAPQDSNEPLDPVLEDRACRLHEEMQHALQIVLCTGKFRPGVYQLCDRYVCTSWTWVGEAPAAEPDAPLFQGLCLAAKTILGGLAQDTLAFYLIKDQWVTRRRNQWATASCGITGSMVRDLENRGYVQIVPVPGDLDFISKLVLTESGRAVWDERGGADSGATG